MLYSNANNCFYELSVSLPRDEKKTVVLKVYLSSIIRKKERYTKLIEQTNQQQTI